MGFSWQHGIRRLMLGAIFTLQMWDLLSIFGVCTYKLKYNIPKSETSQLWFCVNSVSGIGGSGGRVGGEGSKKVSCKLVHIIRFLYQQSLHEICQNSLQRRVLLHVLSMWLLQLLLKLKSFRKCKSIVSFPDHIWRIYRKKSLGMGLRNTKQQVTFLSRYLETISRSSSHGR